MNKNSNRANQERFAAMKLAEINATDKEDLIKYQSQVEHFLDFQIPADLRAR